MKLQNDQKPSLEDLFISKKMDRPSEEFWENFQDEVRSKTLSSIAKEQSSKNFKHRLYASVTIFSLVFSIIHYFDIFKNDTNRNIPSIVVNSPDKTVSVVSSSVENSFIDSEMQLKNLEVESSDAIFADHTYRASSLDSSFHNRVLLSPNQVTLDVSMDSFSF